MTDTAPDRRNHAVAPPPLPSELEQALTQASAPQVAKDQPLTERDFLLIRQAAALRQVIIRAARTARTSAIVTLTFGVCALPFVLFSFSWATALVAVGLCVIGSVEYAGQKRLRRADASAARVLAFNQLALLGLICVYCAMQAFGFSSEQIKSMAVSPEFREQLKGLPQHTLQPIDALIDRWAPLVTYGFYGLVALLSAGCQGGLAAYYFSRRRAIVAFNERTPAWVRRVFIEAQA